MKKHILLLIALCLHIAARGQTIASLDDIDLSGLPKATKAKALRYWFDDDGSSVKTVTQLKGQQSLDVSPLNEGLHTLHYQVVDENNDVADMRSTVFLRVNGTNKQLRYWFDDDTSTPNTITATGGTQMINASHLNEGPHTVHYQVVGSGNRVYQVASALFMKMDGSADGAITAKKLMYWFDDETTISTVDVTSGVQLLDASSLMDGLHTIHYQALCSNGMLTPAQSSLFMRLNFDTEGSTAKKLRYWFDEAQTATMIDIVSGSTLLDASALVEGLHTLHYQLADSKGSLSAPISSVFMKMDAAATTQAKMLRYWFDDDASSVRVVDVSQGTQKLDVSGLLTGLHTLCYQLIDSEGKVGTPYTHIFIKAFDKVAGGEQNCITKYQYWLNKNSQAMQTVELANAANPYQLISLLPMQKEPIHSDCFHFEVTNGQPTVYAKNIFHIRFHDAGGYFADGDRPFIDYSVKQTLTNVELLNHGDHKDTARPVGNEIKWYRLTAEPGDSVQFRLDRAATVQLFAPSGQEIISASASDVVKWFGCHVRESGTYYLALHDVTATQGTTVGIDYEHIDKYAVLRQDVSLVGNGGCSTITFEGNGFCDLYAVDLFTAQGDSIHHVYIGHESDATTSVVFDFTDAALGTYHAKFRFAEEDKVFNNLVTVEEAKDIELATTVTYPSTFLRGTSTTYTIKITNKGNMTAYDVPIYTFIKSPSKNGITYIKYEGIELNNLLNLSDLDSLSVEEMDDICSTTELLGDLIHFMNFHVKDETTGDSVWVRSNNFFVDVAPNETKVLKLVIHSTESVLAYFTLPKELSPFRNEETQLARGIVRNGPVEHLCCYHERYECLLNVFTDIADLTSLIATVISLCPAAAPVSGTTAFAAGIASCISSSISQGVYGSSMLLCDGEKGLWDKIREHFNRKSTISIASAIWNCWGLKFKKVKGLLKAIGDVTADVGNWNYTTAEDCVKAWSEQKPNCPPNPGGGGGSSSPVQPSDPNDIFGYTAESGSHAVKDALTDVYYRIEFENDTAFATASAHDIYVTDTLDASKFDLSTFKPTRVRIGEKSAELTGDKNFVTTIDMRPEINAIAQVEGTYDEKKGIAKWHISSLDPMTMEPTKYVMDGVLPVNYDGKGIGELMYDISLKPNLAHGTEIKNRAGIVFDTNDVIMTPYWTNTIDRMKPTSRISDVNLASDTTAVVSITASDDGSGPWRYNVYVQYGSGAWFLAAENVPADTTATVKIYDGIVHHFYCVATDMAGNVEEKEARSEFTLIVSEREHGDVNGDGAVDVADIAEIIDTMAKGAYRVHADANGDGVVDVADIAEVISVMAAKARAAEMLHKEGN